MDIDKVISKPPYGSAQNTYQYKCLYKEQAKQASSKTANKCKSQVVKSTVIEHTCT